MSYKAKAYLYLVIVALIWGIAGPVIKLTLGGLPPDIFLFYRFTLSSIVLIPFITKNGLGLSKRPKTNILIFIYAFLNSTISLGLLFWGASKTSVLDFSLISLLGPLLLILFGHLFFKDHLTKKEKIGISIAFIGSLVIGISPILKMDHGAPQFFGNFLIFLSVISGGVGSVIIKKLMREKISPFSLANIMFIVGCITMLPIVLFLHPISFIISTLTSLPPVYHLGVIYMAILSGNLAYILNNYAVRSIELSEAAPFAYLYPAISAILGIAVLGDQLTLAVIIGAAATFSGVYLAQWRKRR